MAKTAVETYELIEQLFIASKGLITSEEDCKDTLEDIAVIIRESEQLRVINSSQNN